MQQCRDWLQQHCAFDGCCMAAGCGVPWLSMVHAESILRLSEVQHVPSMSLHKTSCAGCSWHDAAAVASEVDTAEQPQAGQKHASGRALRAAAAVCGEDLTLQTDVPTAALQPLVRRHPHLRRCSILASTAPPQHRLPASWRQDATRAGCSKLQGHAGQSPEIMQEHSGQVVKTSCEGLSRAGVANDEDSAAHALAGPLRVLRGVLTTRSTLCLSVQCAGCTCCMQSVLSFVVFLVTSMLSL